jgi:hypothetical protein
LGNLRLLNRESLENLISSKTGLIRVLDNNASPIFEVSKKENNTYKLDIIVTDEKLCKRKLSPALRLSGVAGFQLAWMEGGRPHGIHTDLSRSDFGRSFIALVDDKRIVPDTNALMNRSLSGICELIGINVMSGKTIGISRLSMLELERIAGQSGMPQEDEEKLQQKKAVMLAMSEVSYLLNCGGNILPELSLDILTGFGNYSGKGLMDAWIRREVRKYFLDMAIDDERAREGNARLPKKKGTFLTSDLISAMAANVEGIDTIYLSYLDDREIDGGDITLRQLTRLIIGVSIMFDSIIVRSGSDQKFAGFWTGKTHDDWFNERICEVTQR